MLFPAPSSSAPTRAWRVSPGAEREIKLSLPGSTAIKMLSNLLLPPAWRRQTGSQGRTAGSGGRKGGHKSFLDSSASFEGKIALSGLVRLEGEFRGEVDADDLVVGQSGRVEAKLSVRSLIVHGTVNGLILAKERVEVGPTGSIEGTVSSPKLQVDEGARIAVQLEGCFGSKQVWLVRSLEAWREDEELETP